VAGNSKSKRKSAGTRKNMTSVVPLTQGITQNERDQLKFIPYKGLENIRNGHGDRNSYVSVYLRLLMGLHLLKDVLKVYEKDNDYISLILKANTVTREIMNKAVLTDPENWNSVTSEEIATMCEGLRIMDEIQDQVTRRELAFAMRLSHKAFDNMFKTQRAVLVKNSNMNGSN
jgi:hypothetical protein